MAASTRAMPAIAEKSFTPTRLSRSKPDGGGVVCVGGRFGGGGDDVGGEVAVLAATGGRVSPFAGGAIDGGVDADAVARSRSRANSGHGFSFGAGGASVGRDGGGAGRTRASSGHGSSRAGDATAGGGAAGRGGACAGAAGAGTTGEGLEVSLTAGAEDGSAARTSSMRVASAVVRASRLSCAIWPASASIADCCSRMVRVSSSTRARVRRAATHDAIGRTNGIDASNSPKKSTSATSAGRDRLWGPAHILAALHPKRVGWRSGWPGPAAR